MAGVTAMNRKFEVTFKIDNEELNTVTYTRRADGPNHALERAGRQLQRDAFAGKVTGNVVALHAICEIECEKRDYPTPDGVTVVTL